MYRLSQPDFDLQVRKATPEGVLVSLKVLLSEDMTLEAIPGCLGWLVAKGPSWSSSKTLLRTSCSSLSSKLSSWGTAAALVTSFLATRGLSVKVARTCNFTWPTSCSDDRSWVFFFWKSNKNRVNAGDSIYYLGRRNAGPQMKFPLPRPGFHRRAPHKRPLLTFLIFHLIQLGL